MEFVPIRDLRLQPARVWKSLAEQGELVVTSNGKPIAILTPVTDQDLEETLRAIRRARAQAAVSRLRAGAAAGPSWSPSKIEWAVADSRKRRKTRDGRTSR